MEHTEMDFFYLEKIQQCNYRINELLAARMINFFMLI